MTDEEFAPEEREQVTAPDPEDEQATPDRRTLIADKITRESTAVVPGSIDQAEADAGVLHRVPALAFPVVAIGSSAGGLQPIKDILESLSPDTGMAFVLIPHLSANHESHLQEITEHYTAMPVQPIEHDVSPAPNHLYILQPNEVARIHAGRFVVSGRQAGARVSHAVDTFFYSLAEDMQESAIGVVLSGADGDGALGLKAIRGEGGVAIVQSPETAQQSSMPQSSIDADHVDLIVSPSQIGLELSRLAKQFRRADVQVLERGQELPNDKEAYQRIVSMLRTKSGLELRQYKQETIRRRIARRMVLRRIESMQEYTRFLQVHADEVTALQEDVLIGVTRFFRDPAFWHAFSAEVLPTYFEGRAPHEPIRVWCAGCSTGEEVYSVAISILEYMTAHGLENTLQIFGTDASDRSIEIARQAVYPESLVTEISPERLRRFFVKVDRGFQLAKRVRDLCIFARQNLCTDPPFSRIDFLTCRNVLIYFTQPLQRQVMQTFHYALDPGGYLLLGMSETLRDYDDWFLPTDRKHKIYTKTGISSSGGFQLPAHRIHLSPLNEEHPTLSSEHIWSELELQRAGDRIVLARFAPPGLVTDEHMNVLQVRGQTSAYVELSSGVVSWNLSRVVRDEIAGTVRDAVQHAIAENVPVSKVAVFSNNDGQGRQVQVDVLPLSQNAAKNRCYMVLFHENDEPGSKSVEVQLAPHLTADEKDRHIAQIRQDLSSTRFHLQSLIEERDARNQELVSANEEIQSANEELQSTNEELETTKEELQSTNEELQTVNDELQQRNAVLTQTGNDLTNLLTSVNIPLLMLTEDLSIRQFTPPMEKLLNMRSTDVGRRVSEIRLQLSVEDIEPILRDVLETLGTREVEVQDRTGRWHLMRVRPYRTAENKIEGLVLVLVDIDQLRHSQEDHRLARDYATALVASIPIPVVVLDTECTIKSVNKSFRELTQLEERDLLGRSLPEIVRTRWGLDGFADRLDELAASTDGSVMQFEHSSQTEDRRVLSIKGQKLERDDEHVILLTMEDITLQRHAELDLAAQRLSLERQVEETTNTLTQARTELEELTAHLFTMQEEERQRIARELHDDVAQRLTALSFEVAKSPGAQDQAGQQAASASILAKVEGLSRDIRLLSHRLHPAVLNDLGLVPALQSLLDEFRERTGMFATYLGSDMPQDIAPAIANTIYRITQEALRNVSKHAGKTHVKVLLDGNADTLRLQIRDFGVGFNPEDISSAHALGVVSMKERARLVGGTFAIESQLGEGTNVRVEVPLASTEPT